MSSFVPCERNRRNYVIRASRLDELPRAFVYNSNSMREENNEFIMCAVCVRDWKALLLSDAWERREVKVSRTKNIMKQIKEKNAIKNTYKDTVLLYFRQ